LPVVWRAAARDDVLRIITYIAGRDAAAARRMQGVIEDAVIRLAPHPFLFRPGRVPGTREMVVHPNYIVVYRVTGSRVEILAVVHSRQEYP
jgi:toxin ParE1/3/4